MMFLVVWLGGCALFALFIACGVNHDRVVVFLLRAVNAPVYEEARMVAGSIYHHPEQWKAGPYGMEHPRIGKLRCYLSAFGVELDGPYGNWTPNAIERRIIFDAVQWYRRNYIRSLLRKEIDQ